MNKRGAALAPDPTRFKHVPLTPSPGPEETAGRLVRAMGPSRRLDDVQIVRIAAQVRRSSRRQPERRPLRMRASRLAVAAALVLGGAVTALAARSELVRHWLRLPGAPVPASSAASGPGRTGQSMLEAKQALERASTAVAAPPVPEAPLVAGMLNDDGTPSSASETAPAAGGVAPPASAPSTSRAPVPLRPSAAAHPQEPRPSPGPRTRGAEATASPSPSSPPSPPTSPTSSASPSSPSPPPPPSLGPPVSSPPAVAAPDHLAALPPATPPRVEPPPYEHGAPPSPSLPSSGAGPDLQATHLADALRELRVSRAPRRALAILDRYAASFAGGDLAHEALLVRVEALLELGRRPEALRILDALPLPREAAASLTLAKVRGQLRAGAGRCREAIADFDAALAAARAGGPDEEALYGRALCRGRTGDRSGARDDLETYRRLFPAGAHNDEVRDWLARGAGQRR